MNSQIDPGRPVLENLLKNWVFVSANLVGTHPIIYMQFFCCLQDVSATEAPSIGTPIIQGVRTGWWEPAGAGGNHALSKIKWLQQFGGYNK